MIRCNECDYCARTRRGNNTRYEYMCKHPDYEYIFGYFEKHRMVKMPRFLGFSKNPYDAPIKTSPAWCPLKKEAADDREKNKNI